MARYSLWDVWPGSPSPLGARCDDRGTNFAVFSEHAREVEVCFFDPADPRRETGRVRLVERTGHVWHGYVPGIRAGTLYGLRVNGPWEPARGLLFNPSKLLVDPYARAITGMVDWEAPLWAHDRKAVAGGTADPERAAAPPRDARDSGPGVPKAVVLDDAFDWGDDAPPQVPWHQTLIYEAHLKGLTAQHPEVPENLRGTYAGMAHPAVIAHLKSLGVTAVEFLPLHERVDDGFLVAQKKVNYWGYNTLGYFAPDQRYAADKRPGAQVREFRQMVKDLHAAGLEVILDVVYNHTCEGNHQGPSLSFRGLDNPTYYWLTERDPRYVMDFTGVGNSLNVRHPQVQQLILDSLRYWVEEMHVDGFRFDLATTLGRVGDGSFDRRAPFFHLVHQDPVLRNVKLIAEPWDVGPDGYRVGGFPVDFAEWNGRYRDAVRRFWRGDPRQLAELGYRLTGSSDLYLQGGRQPYHSVNFVTAHDGFTLNDLVSYERKHNEANGEDNRDGTDDNLSWNGGVEGPTDDPALLALREQQKRNLLATLFLSVGTPMLLAGDELGRTQHGNNNAWCQDNPIGWVDWNPDANGKSLLDFTRRLAALRSAQPVLQRRRFFRGSQIWDSGLKDLAWFRPDGTEMSRADWAAPAAQVVGMLLGGDAIATPGPHGERVVGDTLLVLLNAGATDQTFVLPDIEWGSDWEEVLDTADGRPNTGHTPAGGRIEVLARSLIVLKRPATEVERT